MIPVMLLDDHPMIRCSFEYTARLQPDICVLGSFGNSKELMDALQHNRPSVLILDYILDEDEQDGLSLIRKILAHYPTMRILMASSVETLALIRAAFQIGIRGYINKREESERYFEAIRLLHADKFYIPENIGLELAQLPVRKLHNILETDDVDQPFFERVNKLLSPREAEVLHCFLNGMTVMEIAEKLKRSRKTISGHKLAGMRKLGIHSDPELFKIQSELFK